MRVRRLDPRSGSPGRPVAEARRAGRRRAPPWRFSPPRGNPRKMGRRRKTGRGDAPVSRLAGATPGNVARGGTLPSAGTTGVECRSNPFPARVANSATAGSTPGTPQQISGGTIDRVRRLDPRHITTDPRRDHRLRTPARPPEHRNRSPTGLPAGLPSATFTATADGFTGATAGSAFAAATAPPNCAYRAATIFP